MKLSNLLLILALFAGTGCVEHQSHWRRSQRLGAETPFWQLPAAYVEAIDPNSPFRSYTPLIPTSGPATGGALETGLAPIFDLFRNEVPSQTAPLNNPMTFNAADAVANANLAGISSRQPLITERREAPVAPPAPAPSFDKLPYANAVPNRPGFVTVPGHAQLGEVDVMGIAPGTPVEVPAGAGTVQFRVP
jgi:hypothetical protein